MNPLIQAATTELAAFLATQLPKLDAEWWKNCVEDRLTFQQQRIITERGIETLTQLDFAALLRVLDQNWFELSQALSLPREGRHWIKELQTVRNRWAHQSSESVPAAELYRDIDTLLRALQMIEADKDTVALVEQARSDALAQMAHSNAAEPMATAGLSPDSSEPAAPESSEMGADTSGTNTLFSIGDLAALRSDPDTLVPIIEIVPGSTENTYRVFHNGKRLTYYESQLIQPDEQVTDETVSVNAEELKAHITSLQLLSPSTANLYSLRSGRVQFVPYQYRPVLKLIRADRPRLLIADEVGVGKTIEAGLIIKELRARTDIESVLIICPKALVAERKWFLEMKRFDEHFTALDGQTLRHCLHETDLDGEWPEQYSKSIIPFSLFNSDLLFGKEGRKRRASEGLLALDPPPKFDLVIVDEAHHIRNAETFLHQGIRYFCDNAQAAVFLTATPVQLGSEDLFTLLNVLRPDLVIDHASFEQMAAPNRAINEAVHHCRVADEGWQDRTRESLEQVASTQWGRLFLCEEPRFQSAYDQLSESEIPDSDRVSLIRSLEELYTFSSMINRTRRRDIGEFTTRKPETVTIEFTEDQRQLHDKLLDVVAHILAHAHGHQNVKFMMTTIRRQAASCLYGLAPLLENMLSGKLDSLEVMEAGDAEVEPDFDFIAGIEREIAELLGHAQRLDEQDPKIDAFLDVLKGKSQMTKNKALVFSTFRHTLAYLARHLAGSGIRFGVIHGGIPDDERAALRQRFSLPKESSEAVDVLLSSEVGCEGLDFQFCDLLINYDLPWNPMRIEQRIGRLDRYGQKSETVAIVNLITPGTVDADIYERCLWRIGVFQHAVGGNEEILGEITQQIHDVAESFSLTPEERAQQLQQVADNSIRELQEEQALEEKQAELFGLAVPKQSWRDEIKAAETFWLAPSALQRCICTYLAGITHAPGEFLLGEKRLKTLRLNQEARSTLLADLRQRSRSSDPIYRQWEKWLKGTEPLLAVTFDQETAAANPDAVHLNVLHPLVRQAAHYHRRDGLLHCHLKAGSATVPTGTYPFGLYHWQKTGLRPDDTLVAVGPDSSLDGQILPLLQSASDATDTGSVHLDSWEQLVERHYTRWSTARAEHRQENQTLTEHRLQSLTVSHHARRQLLMDQIEQATNDKIRRMKEAELARAESDYQRRSEQLKSSADAADIHADQIVQGVLTIERDNS